MTNCFSVFDHFEGLALKGKFLRYIKFCFNEIPQDKIRKINLTYKDDFNTVLNHFTRLILCLVVAHTSAFNTAHQTFFLEQISRRNLFCVFLKSSHFQQVLLYFSVWFFSYLIFFSIHWHRSVWFWSVLVQVAI